MNRKEFLKTSGKTMAGITLLSHIPISLNSCQNTKKIEKGEVMIEVKKRRIFLAHTWTISRNSSDYKDNVFVKIEKDGVFGIGEAAPNVRYGENWEKTINRIENAKSIYNEYDLWQFTDIKNELDKTITDQSCAKCALDIAMMDWIGKKLNVPLYKMWGLSKNKTPVTSYSIGIDTAEVIKQKVKEAAPYKILKIKVGKENDKEVIDAVRSVTDKPIRVDANEGWKTKEEALEKIKWLKSEGVEFIEQPLPSEMLEETRWLRDRIDMPIIADEAVKNASDIPKLATAYDGINIKLMKSGGLQEALRMIYMAKALGMQIMLGCMIESSVAITAAAHLSPFVDYADLDGNLLLAEDPFSGVKVKDGKLELNELPGLGVSGEF